MVWRAWNGYCIKFGKMRRTTHQNCKFWKVWSFIYSVKIWWVWFTYKFVTLSHYKFQMWLEKPSYKKYLFHKIIDKIFILSYPSFSALEQCLKTLVGNKQKVFYWRFSCNDQDLHLLRKPKELWDSQNYYQKFSVDSF